MIHHATPDFWQSYALLPDAIRRLADKQFATLKKDPRHPSLRLKKVGRFMSARVGSGHRALAVADGQTLIWFWIGTHADYDKLVGR